MTGWLDDSSLSAVLAALGRADTTRIVGGAVRDRLLGLPVSDIDLATRLAPEEVVRRLEAAGLKAVPTGLAHGTITAVLQGRPFEVTTLRRDVSTDGRHAEVAFTDDWQTDAGRRDFTINALYADPATGEVFDYFNGLADITTRTVRFIGDPMMRIAEDHLRILRFFRFHARFGVGAPDADGLGACTTRANDLMALSRERIRDELFKLLRVTEPVTTLAIMIDAGILAPVLPELRVAGLGLLARLVEIEGAVGEAPSAIRRLAALLPPDVALLDGLGGRLRLSKAQRKRLVATASRLTAVPSDIAPLAYAVGIETAHDLLLLAADDSAALALPLALLATWIKPNLPITGRDVLALGIEKGPEVAQALKDIESDWIAAGFPPERTRVLAMAKARLGC